MSTVRAFHDPVEIRIGRQTRNLMLTLDAYRRAEKALGGEDPRAALNRGGLTPVFVVAACALHHEDRKVSDKTVEAWVNEEPDVYATLVELVSETVRRFLVRTGQLEEIAKPGEGSAPPAP